MSWWSGLGLAGLAAARTLLVVRPDLDVVVLEAGAEIGGKLRLGEVAGIPVDLGAESMLNRRPEGTDLARAVGLGDQLVHPEVSGAGVWTRGAVRPLPPTLMGIPVNLEVASASGILARSTLLRARLERFLPRLDLTEDVAVGRLVAARLGADVRDRLVEPLLGGVYAGRADEISTHAALPQLVSASPGARQPPGGGSSRGRWTGGGDPAGGVGHPCLRRHLRWGGPSLAGGRC